MSRLKQKAALAALAAAIGAWSVDSQAALVGQWTGDQYTAGSLTWNDTSGAGNNGTTVSTGITTVNNAFGTHKAVVFTGGAGAAQTGIFSVPSSASNVLGATAITWVAVFKTPTSQINDGTQFWQRAGLIGKEEGGSVNDWGFGVGATNGTVGVGGADTTITSSNSVTDGNPHVMIGVWGGGALTLYVDGVQVAQNLAVPTAARDANASGAFALGASTVLANGDRRVFNGQVAELRLYNDASQNIAALTNSLSATYAVPEPASASVLGLAAGVFLRRRRRPQA